MSADSVFVLVGVLAIVFVAERAIRELTYQYRAANERISGYIHGYRDGEKNSMPAVDLHPDQQEVPAAFDRAFQ